MALFQTGKTRQQIAPCQDTAKTIESIQVLGLGCKNCHAMLEATKEAVARRGLAVEVGYVTDMEQIAASGVMRLPALKVNGQVLSSGRVLNTNDVEQLLRG